MPIFSGVITVVLAVVLAIQLQLLVERPDRLNYSDRKGNARLGWILVALTVVAAFTIIMADIKAGD